jgi:hypothetical protein
LLKVILFLKKIQKGFDMGENNNEIVHPELGRLQLGGEVARVRLEPGDRKSATTVLRKFGPAIAAESMMFIMENINSPDAGDRKEAAAMMKTMLPYVAQKMPTTTIQKTEDGGEIKTEVKEALMEALGERLVEAEYEVKDDD